MIEVGQNYTTKVLALGPVVNGDYTIQIHLIHMWCTYKRYDPMAVTRYRERQDTQVSNMKEIDFEKLSRMLVIHSQP